MIISINNIRFRNFLSFGNKWQELAFIPGMNAIIGANGSGKTSIMETVPYALFGKTHKDINKEDLVNWKNRKGTEVVLSFTKGTNTYEVLRAIKPDNFEVRVDGSTIPRSSIKDLQAELEDIIGLNLQTFTSLIHSNVNSSTSILSMKKPDKRKFIERVFGLSIYSSINDLCNRKLSSIESSLKNLDMVMAMAKSNITKTKEDMRNIESSIKGYSPNSYDKEIGELEDYISSYTDDSDDILNLESLLKEYREDMTRLSDLKSKVISKVAMESLKIKNVEGFLYENQAVRKCTEEELTKVKYSLDAIGKEHDELAIEKDDLSISLGSLANELVRLKKHMELVGKGVCPTCGQAINPDMLETYIKEVSRTEEVIRIGKERMTEVKNRLVILSKEKVELEEERGIIEKSLKVYDEIDIKHNELDRRSRALKRLRDLQKSLLDDEVAINNNINGTISKIEDANLRKSMLDNARIKIRLLLDNKTKEKAMVDKMKSIYDGYTKDIANYEKEIAENMVSSKKLNNIKDYMATIKELCKDENLKSYALSSIMPFLAKRTNEYMAEIGYPFYLILDKWLEPTIKGPGITNGGYDNLSSGEKKGIDLSLQNAFLDIARIQAGIWPDILIMDEVLDSSVDSTNISKILDIISNKQQADGTKVFIISHRNEIGDIEFDNVYKVVKDNGYSKIV